MVKLFTIEDGRTWNSHKTFLDRLARKVPLTEVKSMEECDVILEFYPVSSRPGHDIDAALKEIPANQPAILVMMHHTADPNRVVYDSSRYMSQSDVITVDCLFYEGKGLFTCPTNEEAVEKTLRHLKKYSKETPPPVQELPKKTPPPVQELPNEPPNKLTTAVSKADVYIHEVYLLFVVCC
ncbi:uncharacterized protein si:ch211-245h14.1 [Conger conger]|uniref:uncharacterized protein si:ch211-245h14.1 n=1 Tax=Conger conger TaxID=82655 RepID=UPI002A59D1AF|nr:uncharacterized protein si:ch211-245h14.1 [Conger conger]